MFILLYSPFFTQDAFVSLCNVRSIRRVVRGNGGWLAVYNTGAY